MSTSTGTEATTRLVIDPDAEPFARQAADVLNELAGRLGEGGQTPQERGEHLAAALDTLARAHASFIGRERANTLRAEAGLDAAHLRQQAGEEAGAFLKKVAEVHLDQNARLHAERAHYARHIAEVRALLDAAGDSLHVHVDALRAAISVGTFEKLERFPFVAGISVDTSTWHCGTFRRDDGTDAGDQRTFGFFGWAVVLHTDQNSFIEPVFRVGTTPYTESQLAHQGWLLTNLR